MFRVTNFLFFYERTTILFQKKIQSLNRPGRKTQTNPPKTPELKTRDLTKKHKTRGFLTLDKSKVPYYKEKDMSGFELKPYVSHQTTHKK
eukprot:gene7478-11802_t